MKRFLMALSLALSMFAGAAQAAQVTQTVTWQVSWQDNSSDEAEFVLLRCQGAGCTPAFVKSLPANTVSTTDSVSGDTGNLLYRYQVEARNSAGAGRSAIVDITSPAIVTIPNAPSGIMAVTVGVTVP